MKVHHHFGDPLFCRANTPVVGGEAKLPADRGLHARSIEYVAFDLRCGHGFDAQGVNGELLVVGRVQMDDGPEENATTEKELLPHSRKTAALP